MLRVVVLNSAKIHFQLFSRWFYELKSSIWPIDSRTIAWDKLLKSRWWERERIQFYRQTNWKLKCRVRLFRRNSIYSMGFLSTSLLHSGSSPCVCCVNGPQASFQNIHHIYQKVWTFAPLLSTYSHMLPKQRLNEVRDAELREPSQQPDKHIHTHIVLCHSSAS